MQRARANSNRPVYIATAGSQDAEFDERIERHRQDRGDEWTVYEQYKNIHSLPLAGKTVVVDCVTLWLSNLFFEFKNDVDTTFSQFKEEMEALAEINASIILVSNEIGMGVHAQTKMGRQFTDLHGWANQFTAARADEVICMISGLPLYLKKPEGSC